MHDGWVEELVHALSASPSAYSLLMVGIPGAVREQGEKQLKALLAATDLNAPVIRYRELTGEFASASALATALGISFLVKGGVPATLTGGHPLRLDAPHSKILLLGLGQQITAMELCRP